MAVERLKGPPRAFEAISASRANAIVDSKGVEASTKAKGMIKDMPRTVSMAKRTMEAMNAKGSKVDQKA